MTDAETETPTSWKQLRVKTNLGTLASILVAVSVLVWQGGQIRSQIDDNSRAVSTMVSAVEELSATVGLTIELDQRTNQLYDEIGGLRDQYSDQADVWIEISTQAERFESARTDLTDLEWRFDDLDRRVSEAFGAEMAGGGEDYSWQITDLIRQVAEIQGRQNAGVDIEWKLEDLESSVDWEIDELTRRVTELQVRMDNNSGDQGQLDDLYGRTDELFDMVWRMWDALQSRSWSSDYLHG